MNKKKKLIPELRFPEFEKDGEWEIKKVEEFFDVKSSKRVLQKDWTNKGIPFYRTRELVSLKNNEPFNSEIYISENLYTELKTKYGVPVEDDFLISGVGTLGICYQVKANDEFYFKDGNVLWFKLEGDLYSTYFKYCFESEHIQKQINAQTSKSTVGTYTIQNARLTKFWYPPIYKEQQKIASCLSSLDDLITAHNDKLEALKGHKKGLMQNLFPQKGEKVPKLRFQEFEKDGEWVDDTFGNRGTFTGGGTPSKSNPDFWKGNFPWVSSSDISEDSIHQIEMTRFITEGAIKNSAAKIVPKNSLLIVSRVGVGKVAVTKENISTSQDFTNFTPKKDDVEFLGYYLKCSSNILLGLSQGMAIKGFTKNDISTLKLAFPVNPKEQQKIASCLSALDELIKAQSERIEQLQQHKKGLMQGLFPKNVNV